MNAGAYLKAQGWRGEGFSLDHTNRGIARPLLVDHKKDLSGLGTKKNDFSNQWWLSAFDKSLSSFGSTPAGSPSLEAPLPKKTGLYASFVKAETLGGTYEEPKSVDMTPSTTANMETKSESKKRKLDVDDEQPLVVEKRSKKDKLREGKKSKEKRTEKKEQPMEADEPESPAAPKKVKKSKKKNLESEEQRITVMHEHESSELATKQEDSKEVKSSGTDLSEQAMISLQDEPPTKSKKSKKPKKEPSDASGESKPKKLKNGRPEKPKPTAEDKLRKAERRAARKAIRLKKQEERAIKKAEKAAKHKPTPKTKRQRADKPSAVPPPTVSPPVVSQSAVPVEAYINPARLAMMDSPASGAQTVGRIAKAYRPSGANSAPQTTTKSAEADKPAVVGNVEAHSPSDALVNPARLAMMDPQALLTTQSEPIPTATSVTAEARALKKGATKAEKELRKAAQKERRRLKAQKRYHEKKSKKGGKAVTSGKKFEGRGRRTPIGEKA